jgi:hypothetical protein
MRLRRVVLIVLLGVLAVIALLLVVVYRATQHVPQFYSEALEVEPAAQAAAAEQMDRQLASLENNAVREGRWHVVFTAEQINGWLAVRLPRDNPELLSGHLSDPRVAIRPDGITVACRAEFAGLHSVVSLDAELYMDSPRVVALTIRKVRAGALPCPNGRVLDGISAACRRASLRVQWKQAHGDPEALISLPSIEGEHGKVIRIEQIRLEDGAIHILGATAREGARDEGRGTRD